MPIPEVMNILERIKTIHQAKNEDYAAVGSPFENFDRSAHLSSWFNADSDKSFAVLVATKLARLATLLNNKGKKPNNESITDSFLDLATYCILWGAKYEHDLESDHPLRPMNPVKVSTRGILYEQIVSLPSDTCEECGATIVLMKSIPASISMHDGVHYFCCNEHMYMWMQNRFNTKT